METKCCQYLNPHKHIKKLSFNEANKSSATESSTICCVNMASTGNNYKDILLLLFKNYFKKFAFMLEYGLFLVWQKQM
jgi:hypothetical protein